MQIEVTSEVLEALLAEAAGAHPRECCGILLGDGMRIGELIPAHNVHPHPATHFEIDPQVLIDAHRAERQGGQQVLGYYHSHPSGKPDPSATDRELAANDGRIWAIIAGSDVTFWRAGDRRFAPLPYVLSES